MPMQIDTQDTWRIFRIMAEFVEGFHTLAGLEKAVSIFGSARTQPDHPDYQAAEETARLLAKEGFPIVTGGGGGIMEAANKGAFEVGGESIGLNITLPEEQEANRYQTISLDFHYFYARKVMFTKYAAAFVCFPGGYGTLDEFFETMTLIQTIKVEPFPVILYGTEYWQGLIEWMKHLPPRYTDEEDVEIFRLVDSPKDVVKLVTSGVKKPWWRPQNGELLKAMREGRPGRGRKTPLEGSGAVDTGEGTVYGKRPKQSARNHVKPPKKPQQ
jgi:uncharacterized protein (TIGR00730 family)